MESIILFACFILKQTCNDSKLTFKSENVTLTIPLATEKKDFRQAYFIFK